MWTQQVMEKVSNRSIFLNSNLAAPRPTLCHCEGGSLTNLMLITAFLLARPKGHRKPRNEGESLSPTECLVSFEPETF